MLNHVPFTRNPDDWHCIHAAMHSVIKHFARDYFSLNYLNALMNPESGMWVWPSQAVKVLHQAGLFVRLFTKRDLTKITPEFIKERSPEHAELTNFKGLSESCSYLIKHGLHEKTDLSLEQLERLMHDGCVPIVILGHKKWLGKYVVLTGYDLNYFYYHESGPNKTEPNKSIDKKDFVKKLSQSPSDNMVIIVYGKKLGDDYSRFHF